MMDHDQPARIRRDQTFSRPRQLLHAKAMRFGNTISDPLISLQTSPFSIGDSAQPPHMGQCHPFTRFRSLLATYLRHLLHTRHATDARPVDSSTLATVHYFAHTCGCVLLFYLCMMSVLLSCYSFCHARKPCGIRKLHVHRSFCSSRELTVACVSNKHTCSYAFQHV